jgi:hypothetical protein
MSTKIKIDFKPEGFAECLQGLSGEVESVANTIASRAESYLEGPGGFTVEMTQAPRYQDSAYGVTRPVAYVYADEEASREEAEDKILSKAVSG